MRKLILLPFVALAIAACSGGDCVDIAGTWTISGACGPDTCVITQSGCSTSFSCSGGSGSYTGSVSGSKVDYSGKSGTGVQGTCTGTVSGNTITGTCTPQGLPQCSFTAKKG